MLRYRFFVLFIVALAFVLPAQAAREHTIVSHCGKTGFTPITTTGSGAFISNEDQWYTYMVAHPHGGSGQWDDIFRIQSTVCRVALRYDDDRHYAPSQPWALRVTYDITTYDSTGSSSTTTSQKLLISYDPGNGTTYTDLSSKDYNGKSKAIVEVKNIEYFADGNLAHSSTSTIPSDLQDIYLDVESDVVRYYQLDDVAPTLNVTVNSDTSVATLRWNYVAGAESYDVEWLFIDGGIQSLTASPGFDFDWRNATRVNVVDQRYNVELAFPRGIVLFRVRPVGVDLPNFVSNGYVTRYDGTWTYPTQTQNTFTDATALAAANAPIRLGIGREPSLNWQYSAGFAEEGKKKEGIGFYDGSLYSRQSLTRVNTDTNLVVAETRYDFEGRPAVQLLPTPVKIDASHRDVLLYQRDFNTSFDRTDFDSDLHALNPLPMDTTATATGAFYSGSNTATDRGKPYIATTNGYAYTKVTYKNDGTNRPSSQSGVGENYKPGGDREVHYYYGTPPQVELDRLFGSEVGFASHYQKNLVTDPNGQVAVSYLDQEGRVVATALAGDVPPNMMAIDNTDYDPVPLTANLLDNNVQKENQMISYSTITVSGTSNFDFTYTLGADTACGGSSCYSVCSDCKYDLSITVYDENNQLVTPLSGTNPVTASNISSGTYTFTLSLPLGVYHVQKVLSLNQAYIDGLRDAFIAAQGADGSCVPSVTAEAEPCALDCHEACEQLYKKQIASVWHYYDANGDEITSNDGEGHTPSQQADILIAACQSQLCDNPIMPDPCTIKYNNMLLDMAPGGQYFDNTPDKDSVDANGDMVFAANYFTVYSPSYYSGHINDWLNLASHSADMLAAINAVWGGTDFTNWDDVRSNWDTAWARILIEWHPEYCAWNYYCNQSCDLDPNTTMPGSLISTGEDEMHAYDQLFFYSTNGNYPNTTSASKSELELFNPVNVMQNTSLAAANVDNSGYMPYYYQPTDQTYNDPRMNCNFDICGESGTSISSITTIQNYLSDFLPIYDNANTLVPNSYHSIWYVIEDPSSIHLGTPTSTGLSQHIIDFYVALHGDGTNPGILTTAGGTVTPFQFFAGVYGYYRQLVIDQGFLASASVASCQTDHSGSAYGFLATVDPADPRTSDGYTVYFPQSFLITLYGSGCNEPIHGAPDMTDLLDNLTTEYDTEDNNIESSYSQATCSCENLHGFITENGLSPTNYTAIADALNDLLEPSALNSGDYTAAEVEAWLNTCSGTGYTMTNLNTDNFPPDLACAAETSEVDVETVEELLQQECQQENTALANSNASIVFAAQVNAAANTYIQQFIAHCLEKLPGKETFMVDYDLTEYHYTLYYYDQAGTLVKTVPPEGVVFIDPAGDDDADGIDNGPEIDQWRIDQRDGTTTTAVNYTPAVHGMVTHYKYNSLQSPIEQDAPDQNGETKFYYDTKGRLILSQNARQRNSSLYPDPAYSYTLYDKLGRAYEGGQVISNTALPSDLTSNATAFATWMSAASSKEQVVRTYYDVTLSGVDGYFPDGVQHNIRGRVTSITYEEFDDNDTTTWDNASHYSYDIHGNVNVLVQETSTPGVPYRQLYTIRYEYDLISGNVLAVHYQERGFDEFHHRYEYDADNRVTCSYTSRDGVIWEKESKNFYYATGPLLRMEIGDKIVQAQDYAYTAQGWIKGMNAGSISETRDIGMDSYSEYISGAASQNRDVARDAAGFVLGYYEGDASSKDDYWAPAFSGQSVSQRFVPDVTSSATQADYKSLYNGNIAYMVTALTDQSQIVKDNQLTAYRYDQLNRIKQVRAHRNFSNTGTYANTFNGSSGDDGKYHEDFSYDRNGNILSVLRNGNNTGSTQLMDDFTYHYTAGTNKLAYVGDAAGATNYTTDIDNQTTTTNYEYDDIGNLISDASEEIYNIDWYANGKIHNIRRTSSSTRSDLEFIYDAAGNRIIKIVKPRDGTGQLSQLHWTYTYYVRDAQGNVLAVYERTYANSSYGSGYYDDRYKLTELDIYGSKRLGLLYADTMQYSTFNDASFTDTHGTTFTEGFGFSSTPAICHGSACVIPHHRTLGNKAYEVTNHLGNVLETVSDRKLPYDNYSYTAWSSGTKYAYDAVRNAYYQSTGGAYQRTTSSSDNKADYYLADVRSYSDYYAFGAQMDGRFGGNYRYDFNGKEKDNENGGDLDFGARIYDPRLGRFLAIDPAISQNPFLSSYCFAANSPIELIDEDGKYPIHGPWLAGFPRTGYPAWHPEKPYSWNIANRFTSTMVGHMVEGTIDGTVMFGSYTFANGGFGLMGPMGSSKPISGTYYRYDFRSGIYSCPWQPMATFSFDQWLTYINGGATVLGFAVEANAYMKPWYGKPRIATISEREALASQFYSKAGYSAADAAAHMKGIDFNYAVFTKTYPKGTILEQWAWKDPVTGELKMGNYYTLPGENPEGLGISLEGRVKVTIKLTEDTKFLQSRAADILDWRGSGQTFKGGSRQLFKTGVKYDIVPN